MVIRIMTPATLLDLARAKAAFQQRTIATILTEGRDMIETNPRELVERLRAAEADERCNDWMCDAAADALTAALDRAEKAEADRDEATRCALMRRDMLDVLMRKARAEGKAEGLREATRVIGDVECKIGQTQAIWSAQDAIRALIPAGRSSTCDGGSWLAPRVNLRDQHTARHDRQRSAIRRQCGRMI